MQELNLQEIEEISGAGIMYYVGYAIGYVISASRVADDEWAWSGGG
ncbi:hypothetical protein [Massilia sp. 9096]|nr:hypothetical protein [Massilia sp. 9096]